MISRSAVKILLGFVLGLPLLLAILGWVAGLLTAMEDHAAAAVLRDLSTGFSVLWIVTVVGLVIALAVESLDEPGDLDS
ncbi:MAG: hypothetical protein GXP24_14255 [Planctomycetes bacterium]|nr:hypothetical protein [Planctomycetota bacterium]